MQRLEGLASQGQPAPHAGPTSILTWIPDAGPQGMRLRPRDIPSSMRD